MPKLKEFGVALKAYRIASDRSIEDIAGAVEVDEKALKSYESGKIQPPEDTVASLVSLFLLQPSEATRMFKLAGYEGSLISEKEAEGLPSKNEVLGELKAYYSDNVQILSNENGVLLSFVQTGEDDQPITISRIGMSKEQAEKIMRLIQEALEDSNHEKQG